MTLSNWMDFEFMLFWTQMTKRLCFNIAMLYFCAIFYTNCWSVLFLTLFSTYVSVIRNTKTCSFFTLEHFSCL